jgi:hypothetical protein
LPSSSDGSGTPDEAAVPPPVSPALEQQRANTAPHAAPADPADASGALITFPSELRSLIAALAHDSQSAAEAWAVTATPDLAGSSPLDAWQSGHHDDVTALLERLYRAKVTVAPRLDDPHGPD